MLIYGKYSITEDGKVFNGNKEIKPAVKNGYKQVCLFENGKRHYFSVHRLVALTFIPNSENKPQVNHIDGNKLNNTVSNLEWVTNAENMQHAERNNLIPKHGREYSINIDNLETGDIDSFINTRSAARFYGKNKTYFSNLLLNVIHGDHQTDNEFIITKIGSDLDEYYFI